MYKDEEGNSYLRRKSFENIHKELMFYKNDMKAEYLYFWADTFLSWKSTELEEFAEIYKDINLPFWMQTRPETINNKRMDIIKNMLKRNPKSIITNNKNCRSQSFHQQNHYNKQ